MISKFKINKFNNHAVLCMQLKTKGVILLQCRNSREMNCKAKLNSLVNMRMCVLSMLNLEKEKQELRIFYAKKYTGEMYIKLQNRYLSMYV